MTETLPKNGVLQWQKDPTDGVAEPPLLISAYVDCVAVSQGGDNGILIQYSALDEFCKNLKALAKQQKEEKLK